MVPFKRSHRIQSRGWLRWLLGQYTQTKPQNIQYQYGKLGKPFLNNTEYPIQFNATDSGDTLLIAFNQSAELGLDIEALPRKVNFRRIAEKKLTPNERDNLFKLPAQDQENAFLALWTRKEAYGKAIGLGIRYPMHQVNLCDDLAQSDYQHIDNDKNVWHLQQLTETGIVACLVSSKPITNLKFFQLQTDLAKT